VDVNPNYVQDGSPRRNFSATNTPNRKPVSSPSLPSLPSLAPRSTEQRFAIYTDAALEQQLAANLKAIKKMTYGMGRDAVQTDINAMKEEMNRRKEIRRGQEESHVQRPAIDMQERGYQSDNTQNTQNQGRQSFAPSSEYQHRSDNELIMLIEQAQEDLRVYKDHPHFIEEQLELTRKLTELNKEKNARIKKQNFDKAAAGSVIQSLSGQNAPHYWQQQQQQQQQFYQQSYQSPDQQTPVVQPQYANQNYQQGYQLGYQQANTGYAAHSNAPGTSYGQSSSSNGQYQYYPPHR